MTEKQILECPNCGRQVELAKPRIGGTFVVRCQSESIDGERCHDEMYRPECLTRP